MLIAFSANRLPKTNPLSCFLLSTLAKSRMSKRITYKGKLYVMW